MGTWGTGLYASDFAMDLRSSVGAVSRLPFEADRLLQIICDAESSAALNPRDDDYSTFWLVVADQFARRGIASSRARETALRIIDAGEDLETQRRLGQTATGLEKRRRVLVELRERLASAPASDKRRPRLSKPQPFLMDVGDVLIYPTCGGDCWNPYTTHADQLKIYGPRGGEPWSADGWGAIVIIERARAFGFFAWYRPLVIDRARKEQPSMATLEQAGWRLESPGNCSKTHFQRMRLEKIGFVPIAADRIRALWPNLRGGDWAGVQDISIANRMSISAVHLARQSSALALHQLGTR